MGVRGVQAWCMAAVVAAMAAMGLGARAADPVTPYKFVKEIPIGGGSGWDYLSAEPTTHRLFVTHGTKVVVIDTADNKVVGEIADTPGVHGFVAAPAIKRGFSSNGQENKSSIVDLETLKTIMKVPTGANPDSILYDPTSGEVWTFNGRGKSVTCYDGKTGKVIVDAIPLDGKPETGVVDPTAERVYVNLEDKNSIAVLDVKTHKVIDTWPIAPGEGASGLAIDVELHRLIAGCANSKMVMLDSSSGKVLASVDCGQGVDAAAIDPATKLAFVSAGGSGTVTIASIDGDKLTVQQTLTTERGARTMTVDSQTHRIYLSNAKSRTDPTSFKVLVYGPEEAAKP
ncbi:MAG TPA: YncE family protein [Phycisphaerae bacterium]|nr:YncE family protein [Phycisphaerae bacterium]